jgi:hypothetical protein
MIPKILLVTTNRWFASARLAMALTKTGFSVEVACPNGHPISKLSAGLRNHPYRPLFPRASFRAAIRDARPDLVIPCDDLATQSLQAIYLSASRKASSEGRIAEGQIATLLERSLGDPEFYPISCARSSLIALANALGVRIPKTATVQNADQLRSWLNENGLPAVLKTDGTSGGVGVRLVYTREEAEHAFAALNRPPNVPRVVKRAIFDRDINLLVPCLLRRRPLTNIQSLICGHDATSAVACWQGRVLASTCFEVLNVWKPQGPASVLRVIENPAMSAAVGKIVEKLKLSGLYGFDFMIEDMTGSAFLIEMNPRATQTCHLPLGPGKDLPAALWSALTGEAPREGNYVARNDVIALFPQEWQRDSASQFLSTAYHDVPWDEPALMLASIQSREQGWGWTAEKLVQMYSKRPWGTPRVRQSDSL